MSLLTYLLIIIIIIIIMAYADCDDYDENVGGVVVSSVIGNDVRHWSFVYCRY